MWINLIFVLLRFPERQMLLKYLMKLTERQRYLETKGENDRLNCKLNGGVEGCYREVYCKAITYSLVLDGRV